MSVFGNFLDSAVVEEAVQAHLMRWLNTYLYEIERQKGLAPDFIARPAFWSTTPNQGFNFLGEERTPAVLVMSPGLAGKPSKEGAGSMRASWVVGVGAVVSATTQEDTRRLAGWYAACIRAVMLQKVPTDLHGAVWEGVTWEDEGYDDLPGADARSLASARLLFTVDFRDVVQSRGGPVDPVPHVPESGPYTAPQTVLTPNINLTSKLP